MLGLAATAVALAPSHASAHAIVIAARPAINSTVEAGQVEIRLEFNSRVDTKRSRLTLQRPDGTTLDIELAPASSPGVLAGIARVAEDGRWTLHWQTLSLDGHITRGEFNFSVRGVAHSP